MANKIRIKRRASGSPGAPSSLENAELAFNEVDNILYYGEGTGGVGGTATTILAIAGDIKADINSPDFTGTPTAPTATPGTNTTQIATTAYVDAAAAAATVADGDKGDITVSSAGTVWTVDADAITNAKLADMGASTLKGNSTAGSANPTDLSVSSVRTMLSLDNVDNTSDADKPISVDTQAALDLKIDLSQKGVASGVATLGSDSKIPTAQLPALAITDTFVVASQVAMLALTAEVGDVAVRTDLNKSFILAADPASTLANWQELLTPTDAVTSVFGRTGVVVATAGDYAVADVTGAAPLASPTFTGNPTAPTPTAGDNDTSIATTAFVTGAISTATTGLVVDSIADADTTHAPSRNAVFDALALKAPLASPALTGTPTAPTAATATNTTQLATTAFVQANKALTLLKANNLSDVASTSTARTNLGLGTMATQDASAVAITGGTIDGITLDGGTF